MTTEKYRRTCRLSEIGKSPEYVVKKMKGLGILEKKPGGKLHITKKFADKVIQVRANLKIPLRAAATIALFDFYLKAYPDSDLADMWVIVMHYTGLVEESTGIE